MTAGESLLDETSFRPAGDWDADIPDEYGVYAIRLAEGSKLPEPFGRILHQRGDRLIYIGKGEKQTLLVRLLGNERRAKGNGTFFRSLGAVLGYRPPQGSLAGRRRQQNYRFAPLDRDAIVNWINRSLEVSWVVLAQNDVRRAEVGLVKRHRPLLNLQENPRALPELSAVRALCRQVAVTPGTSL
jgi:hypothetical protein